jgi:ABC-2 type transport system permease protein
MFLCWVFYDGLALLGSFNLMGDFDFVIKYFGMSYHYDSIQRGVIDSSDLIYFLSLIFLFIASSLTIIKSLKK